MDRVLEPEVMDTAEEAAEYDSMDHTEPNATFLARLLELGASGGFLDIGTGPGHIPLLICEAVPGSSVVGVDLSKNMLLHAERHCAASPHADRVEYHLMDAKDLRLPDAHFDSVYSNTILHHIPDPRPFLREAFRMLRPGGALLIRDLFRPETEARRDELVDLYAADASENQRELFRASLHAAFTPEELRAIADDAGLQEAEVVIDSDRHMSLQIAAQA
jgi:ubiquinone/menaquinone biosynthesis C-methylase UbiE